MAEPLKNSFGPDVVRRIAESIGAGYADFDDVEFLALALDGYEDLELTPRARQIADAMAATLPADRTEAMRILMASFDPEPGDGPADQDAGPMDGFRYLPHTYFVAEHGLDDFETAMTYQYELTKRFTAEFSIRAFYQHHRDATLARAERWATDPSEHVRRLVSEGSRPRLPWAPRIRGFIDDPAPVLRLLELLKDDPSEYVRRSVANNLNDIAKDHPQLVVDVARRWWPDAGDDGRRMIRHGLRTLIKAGDLDALDILGFGPSSPAELGDVAVDPATVTIGASVRVSAEIVNPSAAEARALVDFVVHFVKANGSSSPKVFKGKELTLGAGDRAVVSKKISVAQHSTRTHYPGLHRIEVQLNGTRIPGPTFDLRSA